MVSDKIPLHDAPDHFFDQAKWNEFLSFFESRQPALEQISRVEPGLIVFQRREAAKRSGPGAAEARKGDHIAELGNALVADFKERLITEKLVATGLSSLAVARINIPGERWPELWPNFAEDKATGGQLEFTKVRVFEPIAVRTSAADLLDSCIDWLQNRRLAGESRRKVLQTEAIKHFGTTLTTRIFDAAYKAVFFKTRGRPRTTRPE
jgi:hypothetical protein